MILRVEKLPRLGARDRGALISAAKAARIQLGSDFYALKLRMDNITANVDNRDKIQRIEAQNDVAVCKCVFEHMRIRMPDPIEEAAAFSIFCEALHQGVKFHYPKDNTAELTPQKFAEKCIPDLLFFVRKNLWKAHRAETREVIEAMAWAEAFFKSGRQFVNSLVATGRITADPEPVPFWSHLRV
ncbi:MAG: hypothetical protein V1492_01880 [Candidatus Micrarchaeota archaeon]